MKLFVKEMYQSKYYVLNHFRELLLSKQVPSWGLIVLLVSKVAGLNKQVTQLDCDITAG